MSWCHHEILKMASKITLIHWLFSTEVNNKIIDRESPTYWWEYVVLPQCNFLCKNLHLFLSYHLCSYGWLIHWGQVTHICVSKLTIIGSDNGFSPDRRQAIIWTNAGLLLIGPLGTNFSEIFIEILTFSYKKIHLKVSSVKRRPFCLGLNVLRSQPRKPHYTKPVAYHSVWPIPWIWGPCRLQPQITGNTVARDPVCAELASRSLLQELCCLGPLYSLLLLLNDMIMVDGIYP